MQKQKEIIQPPEKGVSLIDDASLKGAINKAKDAVKKLDDGFLSAKELSLTDPQYEGLLKVLDYLEDESTIHTRETYYFEGMSFNMLVWRDIHNCGSTCCIGGTAEALMNFEIHQLYHEFNTPRQLYRLFYGEGVKHETTPKQAAVALRSYLKTGVTNWDHLKK